MKKQIQLIIVTLFLTSLTAYDQSVGDQFTTTTDGIKYEITAISSPEVKIVDYMGTAIAVTIPPTVDRNNVDYEVTAIGNNAFREKGLTSVTIGENVKSIGSHAFYNNPDLALVIVEANDPPVLNAAAFANANRHEIDLVVPTGRMQVYEDNG